MKSEEFTSTALTSIHKQICTAGAVTQWSELKLASANATNLENISIKMKEVSQRHL